MEELMSIKDNELIKLKNEVKEVAAKYEILEAKNEKVRNDHIKQAEEKYKH